MLRWVFVCMCVHCVCMCVCVSVYVGMHACLCAPCDRCAFLASPVPTTYPHCNLMIQEVLQAAKANITRVATDIDQTNLLLQACVTEGCPMAS